MASRSSTVIISSSPSAKVGGLLTLTIAEINGMWLPFSLADGPLAPKCDSHPCGDWPPNLVITRGGTGSLLYYTKHSSSNTTAWSLLLHLLDPGQGLCIVEPNNLIACILPTCWGDRASALLGERMSSWVRITGSQIAPLGQLMLHFGENVQGLLPITGVIVDIDGMSTAPSHNRAPKGFSFALIELGVKMLCSGATFLA